jgi:hypothetical protein
MRNFGNLFLGLIILSFYFSCERKEETQQLSEQQIDSVYLVYQALNDSLQKSWDVMIQDDDRKLAHLRRLLQEITYTNNYDEQLMDSLNIMLDNLVKLRYDQETMLDSDLIDTYDSASMKMVSRITQLAVSHPSYDSYPLMQDLINDIQEAQNMVLIYRIHYDDYAKEFNKFVDNVKNIQFERDATKMNLNKRPLFELAPAT